MSTPPPKKPTDLKKKKRNPMRDARGLLVGLLLGASRKIKHLKGVG